MFTREQIENGVTHFFNHKDKAEAFRVAQESSGKHCGPAFFHWAFCKWAVHVIA